MSAPIYVQVTGGLGGALTKGTGAQVDLGNISPVTGAALTSSGFWTDVTAGARLNKHPGRTFLGAATANDGGILSGHAKDWLQTLFPSTTDNSQLVSLSTIGAIGAIGGSRGSDFTAASPNGGVIGVAGYSVNDRTTQNDSAYAFYGESRRLAGAVGGSLGIEVDIVNYGTVVTLNPYAMFTTGGTAAMWPAAGGGGTGALGASVGIGVVNNGSTYKTGMFFAAGALAGTDGSSASSTFGDAIGMARNHRLVWYDPTGAAGPSITSTLTAAANSTQLRFTDAGAEVRGQDGSTLLRVGKGTGLANFLATAAAGTGVAPEVQAAGADTNIGITLRAKGTGGFNFIGAAATSATAGTSGALPSQVLGYLAATVNGVSARIPYYAP